MFLMAQFLQNSPIVWLNDYFIFYLTLKVWSTFLTDILASNMAIALFR